MPLRCWNCSNFIFPVIRIFEMYNLLSYTIIVWSLLDWSCFRTLLLRLKTTCSGELVRLLINLLLFNVNLGREIYFYIVECTCRSMNPATACINNGLNTTCFTAVYMEILGCDPRSKHCGKTSFAAVRLIKSTTIGFRDKATPISFHSMRTYCRAGAYRPWTRRFWFASPPECVTRKCGELSLQ